MEAEVPMQGGRTTAGIVRVGDTVRRPTGDHSPFVHQVLMHLARASVPGVPRFLGIDDRGREILTFLAGETGHQMGRPTDGQLITLARQVAQMHDALAGTEQAGPHETVCHHDLAPWNLILRDHVPVGFIDFDGAAPGRRCDDIGYLLWVFLHLGSDQFDPAEQGRAVRLFCDTYSDQGSPGQHQHVLGGVHRAQTSTLQMRRRLAEEAPSRDLRRFSAVAAVSIRADLDAMTRLGPRLQRDLSLGS